jgi:hypothetical protein
LSIDIGQKTSSKKLRKQGVSLPDSRALRGWR